MNRPFLAKRIPFFGSLAMLVLCMVFFLLPFFFRSARFAIDDVKNEVSDWLPSDFKETEELAEFRKFFLGDQFVLVSWPDCNADDPNFHRLVELLKRESLDYDGVISDEEKKAHEMGDKLGWHYTGDYHEDSGSEQERWFQGNGGKWFFITKQGKVYEWKGENDLLQGTTRFITRQMSGRYDAEADAECIATFGTPTDNEFYKDPRKLYARFFKDVKTGPDILDALAGENGSLNILNLSEDSRRSLQVKIDANQRLTGAFFGPTPSKQFTWSVDTLQAELSKERLQLMPEGWREELGLFVQDVIDQRHDGDRDAFLKAGAEQRLEYWFLWWDHLGVEPPPRQTCLMVTLNEPIIDDFAFVVGRGLLGKPRGRILELATGECGIKPDNLHIGGPPVDNVSIDEEGSITLLRLASLSGIIGISLALLSFRSLRITLMLFFVGGVSAISSLGIVWMMGDSMDAILMSMPSLVYALGLSGAIHVVNYYRDACHESGRRFAVSEAVKHAIFPCTIAAFTTALGLLSLCSSSLKPINKFGFYSAIAVIGTLFLLFTYLPAALEVFPPTFRRKTASQKGGFFGNMVERFWLAVAGFVTKNHWVVNSFVIVTMVVVGMGVSSVQTSVQLLKLFHEGAKVLKDYRWMEDNIGKLVPIEVLLRIQNRAVEPFTPGAVDQAAGSADQAAGAVAGVANEPNQQELAANSTTSGEALGSGASASRADAAKASIIALDSPILAPASNKLTQFTLLQRLELVHMIRKNLEEVFGAEGQDIIGSGMSIDIFTPLGEGMPGSIVNDMLEQDFNRFPKDFLYSPNMADRATFGDPDDPITDEELWRISLRLGAFSDVDYGRFVNEIKQVVEPSLKACEFRNQLLSELSATYQFGVEGAAEKPFNVLFIGPSGKDLSVALDPALVDSRTAASTSTDPAQSLEPGFDLTLGTAADQTVLFSKTLSKLLAQKGLENAGLPGPNDTRRQFWITSDRLEESGFLSDPTKLEKLLDRFSVVVLIEDDSKINKTDWQKNGDLVFMDVSQQYQFRVNPENKNPLNKTAEERLALESGAGKNIEVSAVYTGVIPIVYKAQRTLLKSLFESIFLSFVMIALVMMLLLRPWGTPLTLKNTLNFRGGLLAMLPNVFPIVMVFGMMGHLAPYGIKVDIGSMMTASVAMGIAVDDTIHFLTWYRKSLNAGLSRKESIMESYRRCAMAMTQTTLIAGLGLFAFAFSTFTPTQRFGTLMLILLGTALVGDLIFLPALLSSPLGKYFGKEKSKEEREAIAKKKKTKGQISDPVAVVKSLASSATSISTSGPHTSLSREDGQRGTPSTRESFGD